MLIWVEAFSPPIFVRVMYGAKIVPKDATKRSVRGTTKNLTYGSCYSWCKNRPEGRDEKERPRDYQKPDYRSRYPWCKNRPKGRDEKERPWDCLNANEHFSPHHFPTEFAVGLAFLYRLALVILPLALRKGKLDLDEAVL